MKPPDRRHAVVLLPLLVLLVLLPSACGSAREAPALTADAELEAFARRVTAELESHDWRAVIDAAQQDHYRTQVVEHGMGEAQYVAELFGLHRVDNTIKRGERVGWSDLERIESVELERISTTGSDPQLVGTVTLRDGITLAFRARVTREDGRYVLTGGLG